MRVWAFCVLVAFSLIELYQWLHTLKLPLSAYGVAGLLLAFASNTDHWVGFLKRSANSASPAIPSQGISSLPITPGDAAITATDLPAAMSPSTLNAIKLAEALEAPEAPVTPPRVKATPQLPKLTPPLPPSPSFTLRQLP